VHQRPCGRDFASLARPQPRAQLSGGPSRCHPRGGSASARRGRSELASELARAGLSSRRPRSRLSRELASELARAGLSSRRPRSRLSGPVAPSRADGLRASISLQPRAQLRGGPSRRRRSIQGSRKPLGGAAALLLRRCAQSSTGSAAGKEGSAGWRSGEMSTGSAAGKEGSAGWRSGERELKARRVAQAPWGSGRAVAAPLRAEQQRSWQGRQRSWRRGGKEERAQARRVAQAPWGSGRAVAAPLRAARGVLHGGCSTAACSAGAGAPGGRADAIGSPGEAAGGAVLARWFGSRRRLLVLLGALPWLRGLAAGLLQAGCCCAAFRVLVAVTGCCCFCCC
jgi:hypothetical protein